MQFIYFSFTLSGEQEENFVDASKGDRALEHDLQAGSQQTEESDTDIQKLDEVSLKLAYFVIHARCLFMFFLNFIFISLNDILDGYFSDG